MNPSPDAKMAASKMNFRDSGSHKFNSPERNCSGVELGVIQLAFGLFCFCRPGARQFSSACIERVVLALNGTLKMGTRFNSDRLVNDVAFNIAFDLNITSRLDITGDVEIVRKRRW